MLKRLALFAAWFAIALTASAATAAKLPVPKPKDVHAIDVAGQQPVIDLRNALIPYQPASGAEHDGSRWYMFTAMNEGVRPVTRILQANQPPGIGLRFFKYGCKMLHVAGAAGGNYRHV